MSGDVLKFRIYIRDPGNTFKWRYWFKKPQIRGSNIVSKRECLFFAEMMDANLI